MQTEFGLGKLNDLIDEQLILFSGGQARANLDFQVALDDLKLHQPHFKGEVGISQADLLYRPNNLRLKTDVDLAFTDEALSIKNVKYVERRQHARDRRRSRQFLQPGLRRRRRRWSSP